MDAIWIAFVIWSCESCKDAPLWENSHILFTSTVKRKVVSVGLPACCGWRKCTHACHVIRQIAAHVYGAAGGLVMSESNHQLSLFATCGLPRDWLRKQILSVFWWVKTETVTARWTLCSVAWANADYRSQWRRSQMNLSHITCLYIHKQHILYYCSIISCLWGGVYVSGQGENIFYLIRNKDLILFMSDVSELYLYRQRAVKFMIQQMLA